MKYLKIKNIKYLGKKKVYNIALKNDPHNFLLENNIVSCNSHAVSYATVMFLEAYLKAHYFGEYIVSYLNFNSTGSNKEKQKLLIQLIKKEGIEISDVHINKSLFEFTYKEYDETNKIVYYGMCGLSHINKDVYNTIHSGRPYGLIDKKYWKYKSLYNSMLLSYMGAPNFISFTIIPMALDISYNKELYKGKKTLRAIDYEVFPLEKFFVKYSLVNYIKEKINLSVTSIEALLASGALDKIDTDINKILLLKYIKRIKGLKPDIARPYTKFNSEDISEINNKYFENKQLEILNYNKDIKGLDLSRYESIYNVSNGVRIFIGGKVKDIKKNVLTTKQDKTYDKILLDTSYAEITAMFFENTSTDGIEIGDVIEFYATKRGFSNSDNIVFADSLPVLIYRDESYNLLEKEGPVYDRLRS